ncbi:MULTISPECIES: type IV-A pilus assembly ATPase PilB [Ralstonia]|jgi:type IV pilus assembly protein PilB|uniref:Bacterial type II secretion system protein E domain-containing protein n=3 Tax=Ralstonia TaxID=48736 RepID=A0AAD2BV45_9RALS|nr:MULTISPECIES: type IV-A pilus assembly ATPase PilB [Ralstonia]MEA3271414.1 type IV-A pilus assembly ATPase PilB [Pseudomonadota bacterium]ENZ76478.1 type IV-A pilus assembly ATPase PilB [Ralstonia pickettii OR214]MBB0025470.1 type IV-A pilus assembly ATPase PilB [Ralstonia pickettii]MBB0036350.1 type IV-A pilus assembly ATPase PilB [Ralstonia pickettii]MBB0098723.1 type IV-A pilus assembly ATPase PilB [Ralstonia pickettii]
MTLGLALAQSRRIAPTLLTQLEQSAREKRTQLIDELVGSGIMSAHDLAVFVAGKYQMPLLDLAQYKLDTVPAVLSANKHFAQLRLLPLGRRENRLILATSDPSDPKPIEELRQKMNVAIETVIVEHDKLVRQLSLANEAPAEIKSLFPKQEATQIEYDAGAAAATRRTTPDGIDDAPVVRFLQKLFTEALLRGASDLHFEPFETFYRVRFRIDGILAQVAQPPLDIRDKIATRIKVLSRLDISEKRVPQDGRMKLLITVPKDRKDKDNKETIERAIDFRVSTLPTLFGEKIVIRILESSTERLDIDQLGYEPEQKQLLLDVIKRPYGMVLVTGPTGSGKTVSLYTFLNRLNQGDINISTAEDPAEIQLPGINQVNVNDKAGLTFAAALKSFLRQDPDIIMVGEIRDLETADISIKAAQTGHLVFSTLHTNDAPTTLTRLMNMGVAPFNIASSVLMITAQRLGRRLCKDCKKPGPLPKETLLDAGFTEADLDGSWQPYHPVGCETCNGSGYKGRVGIYQVMPITEAIQEIILTHGTALQIAEQARKDGVMSLRESGLRKVKQGLTSLEEVLATTNQ